MMSKSLIRNAALIVVVCGLVVWSWSALAISAEPAGPVAANEPQLVEVAQPQTLPEKIDGAFAGVVSVVEKLLFHRLFQTEREFVTYSQREVFARDRGTTGAYQRLGDAGQGRTELTERDIRFMAARGELLDGHTIEGEPQQYRWGLIGERAVETITVRVPNEIGGLKLRDGDKFVKTTQDGQTVFAKVGPMRGLLDTKTVLTPEAVTDLAKQGLLAGGPTGIEIEAVGGIPIIVLWLGLGGIVATIMPSNASAAGSIIRMNRARSTTSRPSPQRCRGPSGSGISRGSPSRCRWGVRGRFCG
jgi:hypothetical protein